MLSSITSRPLVGGGKVEAMPINFTPTQPSPITGEEEKTFTPW
jgi:hypothetical protein